MQPAWQGPLNHVHPGQPLHWTPIHVHAASQADPSFAQLQVQVDTLRYWTWFTGDDHGISYPYRNRIKHCYCHAYLGFMQY